MQTCRRLNIFQDFEIIFEGYTKIIVASEIDLLEASIVTSRNGSQVALQQARTSRNAASNLLIVGGTFAILYYMTVFAAQRADDATTAPMLPVIQWVILAWAWKLSSQRFWFLLLVILVVLLQVTFEVWLLTAASICGLSFMHIIKASHRR